jgi:hypothetical protein
VIAGGVASHFGYPAAFVMAAAALLAAAVAGKFVFSPGEPAVATGGAEQLETVAG